MTLEPVDPAPWQSLQRIPGLAPVAFQLVQDLSSSVDEVRWTASKMLSDMLLFPTHLDFQHVHHALPLVYQLLQDENTQEPEEWAGLLCRLASISIAEHPSIQTVRQVLKEHIQEMGFLLLHHPDALSRTLLACTLAALPEGASQVVEPMLQALQQEQDTEQCGELWCALCQQVWHFEKQHLPLPELLKGFLQQLPIVTEVHTVVDHMQILLRVLDQSPTDLHLIELLADSYDEVYDILAENGHEGTQHVTANLLSLRPLLWEQLYMARFTHEDEVTRGNAAREAAFERSAHPEKATWLLEQLTDLLSDPSEYVQQEVLEVLETWEGLSQQREAPALLEQLLRLLQVPSEYVRPKVIEVLKGWEDLPDIASHLYDLWLENEPYSSDGALELLLSLSHPLAIRAVLSMLESGKERSIFRACKWLIQRSQPLPEAIPVLRTALSQLEENRQKWNDRHGLKVFLSRTLEHV